MVPSLAILAIMLKANPPWAILVPALVGLAGAILGAVLGASVKALMDQRGNRQLQENQIFFDSLEWFTKGRQRRNVGISAVEAFQGNPRLRSFSIPLLIGTAIYLLRESSEEEESGKRKVSVHNKTEHDSYNMTRIMRLLLSKKSREDLNEKPTPERRADYKRLLDVIVTQTQWLKTNDKGLEVESKVLDEWAKELRGMGIR